MPLRVRAFSTLVVSWLLAIPLGAQPPIAEYRLKAAFLHRFPEFVTWPPSPRGGGSEFEICVSSPSPFGSALTELTVGDTLNGRPFAIREVDLTDSIDTCHVLFIAGAIDGESRALLQRARDLPILTVGESLAFLDQGGIILLRVVNGRVGFDVSLPAARRSALQLSSQMLRVALRVRS
jgi:hypothetical protein